MGLVELTAVSVDELGVDETDFEVVEHGRLVEVAERCEVILAHQDVRVPQVRQVLRLGVQFVLEALRRSHQSGNKLIIHLFIVLFFLGSEAQSRWWTSAKQNGVAASTLHSLTQSSHSTHQMTAEEHLQILLEEIKSYSLPLYARLRDCSLAA